MNDLFCNASTGPRVRNLAKSGITPATLPSNGDYIGHRQFIFRYTWTKSDWFNKFEIAKPDKPRDGDRATVIAKHAAWLCDNPELMARLPELRGNDLYCWCAPEACNGDLLLRLANG